MIRNFSNVDHKLVIRIHCPNKDVTLVPAGVDNREERMCVGVEKVPIMILPCVLSVYCTCDRLVSRFFPY